MNKLSPDFVVKITNQLQQFEIVAEALVLGMDEGIANIFHVDNEGVITCHSDIGFASCGLGGIHATSYLMLSRYSADQHYYGALLANYTAKKRSEVAPGVGHYTDMQLVLRDNILFVNERVTIELDNIYSEREKVRIDQPSSHFLKLAEAHTPLKPLTNDQGAKPATSSKDQTRSDT